MLLITIESQVDPRIGWDEYLKNQAWLNPENAAALQRIRLRQGRKIWEKTYRYTNKGVHRLRKIPKGRRQENRPPKNWTQKKKNFYEYNLSQVSCPQVLSPSGLLYFLSAHDFSEGDSPLHLCVFSKKQLHQVSVQATGSYRHARPKPIRSLLGNGLNE